MPETADWTNFADRVMTRRSEYSRSRGQAQSQAFEIRSIHEFRHRLWRRKRTSVPGYQQYSENKKGPKNGTSCLSMAFSFWAYPLRHFMHWASVDLVAYCLLCFSRKMTVLCWFLLLLTSELRCKRSSFDRAGKPKLKGLLSWKCPLKDVVSEGWRAFKKFAQITFSALFEIC